ncbi:MAG: hypothetical protein HY556_06540 [Euryarchaeota archaeon]|nr:hypothetical protein [Euryarchaeota archaeon]
MADVIAAKRALGFEASFTVLAGARILCLSCKGTSRAGDCTLLDAGRLEGSSDPADEILVACFACPRCGVKGTAVLGCGPLAPVEHSKALGAFKDSRK